MRLSAVCNAFACVDVCVRLSGCARVMCECLRISVRDCVRACAGDKADLVHRFAHTLLDNRAHHLSERVRRTLLEPTLRWHAVAVSPRWRLTRPDADAAHAEPSPGADLKSDPVRNWLAAQAPATGAARRRQDHDMLRGASIDAIGLVTGR